MARPPGTRNHDYEEKRAALVEAATDFAMQKGVHLPSFRQFAIATGSSEPTLRHYFEDRTGLIKAIIENLGQKSEPLRAQMQQGFPSIDDAIWDFRSLAARMVRSSRFRRWHAFAARESLADNSIMSAYLEYLFDPAIAALAKRISRSSGGPATDDLARSAASIIFLHVLMTATRDPADRADSALSSASERPFEHMAGWLLHGIKSDPASWSPD